MKVIQKLDPLEALAAGIDLDNADGSPAALPGQSAEASEDAKNQAALDAVMNGLGLIALGLFKALRKRAARNTPEVLEYITDEMLQGPVDALPPVIQKHMAKLSPIMGMYPEECLLVMSVLPIGFAYVSALEANAGNYKKIAREAQSKPTLVTSAPAANAAPGHEFQD